MTRSAIKAERKIALPIKYPELASTSALSQVMVTLSPPVSPSVVARILMIQKPSVTSGTLFARTSKRRAIVRTETKKGGETPASRPRLVRHFGISFSAYGGDVGSAH